MYQASLFKTDWKNQFSHGGKLRQTRAGRKRRALSCKEPLHVVFKINKSALKQLGFRSPQTFAVVQLVIQRYAKKFFIKIEQLSVQNDHIHILIRTSRRSLFHYFFRVVAGQIAQQLKKEGLLAVRKTKGVTDTPKKSGGKLSCWKYRPFSRVVRGYKAYKKLRDYIQLNEKEGLGVIKYNKLRLRGLSMAEWEILWS